MHYVDAPLGHLFQICCPPNLVISYFINWDSYEVIYKFSQY